MRRLASTLLLALLAAAASAQPADTLHATLDLRASIADGWFDPSAETVGLRGAVSPLSWSTTTLAADPEGDGLYSVAVPFRVTGDSLRVDLKIKVDGTDNPNGGWQEGADHTVMIPRGGTSLALAWEDRVLPSPAAFTGRIDSLGTVEAEGLAAREVWVWLPPGYADAPARRYPVLYLHDGASMFGHAGGAEWGMDEAATALIASGEIEPLILVAVANTANRTDEYTPTRMGLRRLAPRLAPPTSDGPQGAFTGLYNADGDTVRVAERDGGLQIYPPEADAWFP
ncbi:MAG: alpha/beta hydrolase-fold protein, partial [Bacteroidota bacterium]